MMPNNVQAILRMFSNTNFISKPDRVRTRLRWLVLFGSLGFICNCLYPSLSTVKGDQSVGIGSISSATVKVDEGLATIRSFKQGKLSLWASAPSFRFRMKNNKKTEQKWEISVHNVMPKAKLKAYAQDKTLFKSTEQAFSHATKKKWLLVLPAEKEAVIEVGVRDAEKREGFRFLLMSDVQDGIEKVTDLFKKMNTISDAQFVLSVGDLSSNGTEEQLQNFQEKLESLNIPFFSTMGNHDMGPAPRPWHQYFGRSNFSFRFKGVYFTMIDSGTAAVDPLAYKWLDAWLKRARDSVHVVGTHIPPIDPVGVRDGSFANKNDGLKFLQKLAAGKVDLTLYGHVHSFYKYTNAGIPAYISGGGGAFAEKFDQVGRHFLQIEIHPKEGVRKVTLTQIEDDDGNPRFKETIVTH